MAPATTVPRARLLGGLAPRFAVLGGAIAWALHLFAAWGAAELVCASGHEDVSGTSLRVVLLLAAAVPLAITLVALGVAWLAWSCVLPPGPHRLPGPACLLLIFCAGMPPAGLGVLLAITSAPLYPAGLLAPSGGDPLTAQQLGGVVMWATPRGT